MTNSNNDKIRRKLAAGRAKAAQANSSEVSIVALTAKSIFESCQSDKTKPHAFSKTVAELKNGKQKLGWASAVVLRYLCYMLRVQGKEHDGKEHVRINLDHIEEQYSYLGRSGVDKAIARLKEFGACSTRNLNVEFGRSKIDRTRWYCVPKQWMDLAETELRYFYPPLAAVIGVPAAVIHYNFSHWITELAAEELEKPVKEKKEVTFGLFPETLAKLQPFSDSTIKRAIKTLVDEQLLFPVPEKRCLYSSIPLVTSRSKVDMLRSKVDMLRSKVDMLRSKVDMLRSKVDMLVSKVDDNSCCSNVIVPFVESSKTQPAVASNNLLPCADRNDDTSKGLEHIECLSPFETLMLMPTVSKGTSSEHREFLSPFQTESTMNHSLPVISSYQELHRHNQAKREIVAFVEQDTKAKEVLIQTAWELTDAFLRKLGNELVDELYDNATSDERFEELFPLYRSWYPGNPITDLFPILYYGVFECVLDVFRDKTNDGRHPFSCFRRISYSCHLNIIRRIDARNQQAIQEEQQKLQEQHASIDVEKEWDTSLSPAEKARVFKQGVYSRNKVGWICLGGERLMDQIIITSRGLKDTEKLFSMNPDASAGDLLLVMDRCMKLHSRYLPVKNFRIGIKWHARMGHRLSRFTRHLKTIMKQEGLFGELPFHKFLNEAIEDAALLRDAVQEDKDESDKMAA